MSHATHDVVPLAGGEFAMGSDEHHPGDSRGATRRASLCAPGAGGRVRGRLLPAVPARRSPAHMLDTGMSHGGFRCAGSPADAPKNDET